jgi:hypothetical protein
MINTGFNYSSYHYLFDRQGKYYGDFTPHLPTPSASISNINLPIGYVQISPGMQQPYYVVQLETGKAFRE